MQTAVIMNSPFLRRALQPKRIPLLFSVTIIAGIFYHYAPELTWLWILLSVLLQCALFKLFDYVNKHHIIGGIAYLAAGFCLLCAAIWFMKAGGNGFLAPENETERIDFFVWFMTPQSVLPTRYTGYTYALFILFSFFIASITYYFTIVRYRVLMSFMVMIFPFAIYAKEAENMPVPSIILLFLCYFAVMIYCRQAHGEHPELVQTYVPNGESTLKMPPPKSENAEKTPEILDRRFVLSGGIFLAAASIAVLVIPKPNVVADRSRFDAMLNLSRLSAYLENAISGFAENSDGGGAFLPSGYTRTLYYADAEEVPLNLKVRTLTDYSYNDGDGGSWHASEYDGQPAPDDTRYHVDEREYLGESFRDPTDNSMQTVSEDQHPYRLLTAVIRAARRDSSFAARWGISAMADMELNRSDWTKKLTVQSGSYIAEVYPTPNHTAYIDSHQFPVGVMHQNASGVVFRYTNTRSFFERYELTYYTDLLAQSDPARLLQAQIPSGQWAAFLSDLQQTAESIGEEELKRDVQDAVRCYLAAVQYAEHVTSETPARVRELAEQITAGCTTDAEKAAAVYQYLKYGSYTYSLSYSAPENNNVEYFLFESKTGVCYQFASAMAELCRAVGLPVRYAEGYMLSTPNESLSSGGDWQYIITTDEAHAFTEVYLAGYGWLMLDATAPSSEVTENNRGDVLTVLQLAGLIFFGTAVLLLFVFIWLLPHLKELFFRMRFRRSRDADAVQKAFARLRKQWHADPAKTAHDLCAEQSRFLGTDLSVLCAVFEETLYADRCTPEQADRFYEAYCTAYDAYKDACRRAEREKRAAAKAARTALKQA